jgi:hypothetical protein
MYLSSNVRFASTARSSLRRDSSICDLGISKNKPYRSLVLPRAIPLPCEAENKTFSRESAKSPAKADQVRHSKSVGPQAKHALISELSYGQCIEYGVLIERG